MQPTAIEGFRLSPQQRRAWLLGQSSPACHAGCVVALAGSLDPAGLARALAQVVARHDILRTVFRRAPGVKIPIQVVRAELPPAWREIDLRAEAEPEARIDEIFAAELAAPLPVETGPLLRASLLRLAADRHALVLATSPLHADAHALGQLLAELAACYGGEGGGLVAAEDLVQYVQFSEWQHELLESEEGEEGRNYWSARPPRNETVTLGLERRQ